MTLDPGGPERDLGPERVPYMWPFRTLLEELRAQSGTRYAPNVVALFEDERFCQQLAENTDAERKRVYLQVYHAGSEEK